MNALQKVKQCRADDLEAARATLERPEHYGGETGIMVKWARAVLEREKTND